MHDTAALPASSAPIGVFDSGVGGLSVLRHIRACLNNEHLVYVADARYAPYGERTEIEIEQRALSIGAFLVARGVKAIVVACNTATAVAIGALREAYPSLIVVGVEPGLKPAAALTRSNIVGVLATEATLASEKFKQLRDLLATDTDIRFLSQPCNGLADQIERGAFDDETTRSLLQGYIVPLLREGADTLVLGCTHYPFVLPQMERLVRATTASPITIIDTGEAVARHLQTLLVQRGLHIGGGSAGSVCAFSSGDPISLRKAFLTLLDQQIDVSVQNF
jgi:glutamate racemase